MLNKNNVIAYIRVSTDEQGEGYSLPEQENKIRAYCLAMGYRLVKVFSDTMTGGVIERPAIDEIKEYLFHRPPIKALLVYKLDRLSRNLKNLLIFIEDELTPAGISLISVTEQFDSGSPIGKFFIQMIGSFSEYERNLIKERTRLGMEAKKKAGGYYAGPPVYGFQTDHQGNLSVNPAEVEVCKLIWRRRCSGESMQKIADYLNDKGIKPRRGQKWFYQSVKNVFNIIKANKEKLNIQ